MVWMSGTGVVGRDRFCEIREDHSYVELHYDR